MKQKQTHRHREKTHGCQGSRQGEGGMWGEFAISRCKLLYIEWINNKGPLYSPESYIQYSEINPNEKEKKMLNRKSIYVQKILALSLSCNVNLERFL